MSGVRSRGPVIGVHPLSSRAKNLFVPLMMRWAISADKSALGAIHLVRTHKFPDFRPPTPPVRTYYDVTMETIHWRTQSA